MRTLLGIAAACLLLVTSSPAGPANARGGHGHRQPTWHPVGVDTDQQFRGLDATDRRHAWVSGSKGGVWKTHDGGKTWIDVSPPEGAGLLLRDVEILRPGHVLVMSVGEEGDSRILRTTDGGRELDPAVRQRRPGRLLRLHGDVARRQARAGDERPGRRQVPDHRDHDGGATWSVVDPAGMPDAVEGEFGFAASGTCLVTAGRHDAYLASGGAASPGVPLQRRRAHLDGGGLDRSRLPRPVACSRWPSAARARCLAVGGDFTAADNGVDMSAYSHDRGRSWTNGGDLGGYRSGVDWLSRARATAVAVGPTGSDISYDGGRHWQAFDDAAYDAVQCPADGSCWASGPAGAVARLVR